MTGSVQATLLHRDRAHEAGFTLLELLIATTVLAFLSLLLFGGLRFGTRVWEKAETSTSDTNRVRGAQQVLAGAFERIYPFFVSTPLDHYVDFQGDEERVSFLAPSKTVPGEMDQVTIAAVPARGGVSVVMASYGELSATPAPRQHTLISGLKWFQISYYGPPPAPPSSQVTSATALTAKTNTPASASSAPAQWTSVWKGQSRLPLLIRVRARLADKTQWPDLVVSPRIDVDEGCVLDQLTKYCQGR